MNLEIPFFWAADQIRTMSHRTGGDGWRRMEIVTFGSQNMYSKAEGIADQYWLRPVFLLHSIFHFYIREVLMPDDQCQYSRLKQKRCRISSMAIVLLEDYHLVLFTAVS